MRNLFKKLRRARGLTLSEVLTAVLILALVSVAAAVGVSTALRVYRESTGLSESRTISATLSQAVMDELRYARDVQADGSYTSSLYGPGTRIESRDGKLTVHDKPLVGDGIYGKGRFAADVTVAWTGTVFQVTLTVTETGGGNARTAAFSVSPMN